MKVRLLMVLTVFLVLAIAVLVTSAKVVTAGGVRDVPASTSCSAAPALSAGVEFSEVHVGGTDECQARCLLNFCRHPGTGCSFTHTVLRNNGDCCCEYNCVDDSSCTTSSQPPSNACPGT
jgi:hypothetical protein